MKPISSIQREAMEEEEELQMKPISSIQREAMEEEEELQMKPISSIQREAMEEEEELQMKPLVQRRENLGGGEASTDLESSIQSARGSGQSLDANLQRSMGQAMGADFSGVKVHTDSQSDQLNKSIQAKAFTTGQDVFFRQGAYEPSSRGGQELIAHELTHVVQQGNGINRSIQRKNTNIPLLDEDMVSHQLLGSTKTENIQNCINKYNLIANGDPNYDQQLKILGQLLSYVEQWLVKNPLDPANSNRLKIEAIEDIKTKATAEQTTVTDARKQAVDAKILEKNNPALGSSSPKFEELSDAEIKDIVKNNKDVITAQVLSELGVGIGAWRRSKETNEFRQVMKDAARQQAEADILASNIIETKPNASSNTPAETAIGAKYQKMMAKLKAQSSAKGAVDKAMEDAAKNITEEIVKEPAYEAALNAESRKAANDMALKFISTDPDLSNPATLKAIEKAKLSAASTKAAELLADNKQKAIEKAKDTQETTSRDTLADEVKLKATDMKVGEKALEGVRDSKAIGSTFTGTATTEKIKNSINEYNSIANSFDYDNKLLFLDQLLADANAWLSRYSGPNPPPESTEISSVKVEAETKKAAVEAARELAVNKKISDKNPPAGGPNPQNFEDLSDAEIDAILTEHKAVIKAKVLSKLGVGRGARRRSKETNKFRQDMKDTARAQAAADIRTQPSGSTTTAMTNYKAMVAEVEAYSTSKGSVDAAMAEEAKKITEKFVEKDGSNVKYKEKLNLASSNATKAIALKFISTDPDLIKPETQEAIAIAKSSAARTEAKNLLISQSALAIKEAKAYTHGTKDQRTLDNLNDEVKNRVTSDKIGKNAVNKVITATTLDNGFSRVAGLIDTLLPSNGSIGLNIVLKIKDPQTNVFFITQLKGEATKEQGKEVSLRSELSLGAGWEMFGMSASGQAGFFFDATSTDTNKAVSLISYGLYRRLQTENLDSTVANTIWGYGGKSQLKDKGEEAETWATAMEEYLFKDAASGGVNDKSKVDVGMLVKGNAEANLGGVAKGEFEAKYSTAKQYSAASMGMNTASASIGTKKAKSSPELKAALAGKDVSYFDISAAIEAFSGFAGGELSAKFGWDGSTFNSFDLKGAGLLSNALGSDGSDCGETVDKVCKSITAFITSAAASGRNLYNIAKAKQGENAEKTGQIGSILNNVGTIAVSAGDLTGKEWGKSLVGGEGSQDLVKSTSEVSIMNPLLEFKDNLRVGLTLSWKVGSPPEIKVDISQVKAAKLDTGSAINVVGSFKMEGKITTEIISQKFTL
jgi:hypothetical protein